MPKLPLLRYTEDLFPNIILEDTIIIACQHLLGSTVDLFDSILNKGADPKKIFVLGKCYSTHPSVIANLKKRGVYVSPLSTAYQPSIPFDESYRNNIEKFFLQTIKRLNKLSYSRVIILDDGGMLISFANDFFDEHIDIICIEQTSSGYEKIKTIKPKFPVINVARSKAKLLLESPFIANVVVSKINDIFSQYNERPKLLIVGNGPIGSNIYKQLKKKFSVHRYNLKKYKNNFPGAYEKKLHLYDGIIGATGNTILAAGHYGRLKKGVHLISCSSSDREFSGAYLRKLAKPKKDCHATITTHGITLHNSGFPINFDGKKHSIVPHQIQITRSLLLAAVLHTADVSKNTRGIIDLPKHYQTKISKQFKKIIERSAAI